MAKLNVVNVEGKKVGDITLSDEIFGIEPNEFAVQAVIKNYLANQRQGTQSAKTRSEVRGGGRKPFRQKGTGRHRQGSSTDPSQIGGGIVFAPKPRSYRYSLNKKLKRLALKSALSAKVADNELIVVDVEGKKVGDITLSDEIFGIEPNEFAVQAVIKNYLANQRQGTQSAKTRAEVRGGGRKPFRQKGTGRHRQGSSTDPTQVGGGVVFAPKPRSYRYNLNKKLKRLALKSALSAKVADNELIVVKEFKFEEPKTKEMVKVLANIKADKKALIVMDEKDDNVVRSAHNIPGVRTALVSTMNVYEIVNHYTLVLTQAAAQKIEEVYA